MVFRCYSVTTQPPIGVGCPLCRNGLDRFGYRDVLLLRQFLTPDGYIIGRRKTGIYRAMETCYIPCKHIHKTALSNHFCLTSADVSLLHHKPDELGS